ncbi:hypothetical protein [Pseudooceanicola atlanticus]|uniref:hypothetical protein n=1 Tax=Pseudooceanicola atlanticus TaxID=1461694 RepID=UPI002353339F|nr:hypothetical protein [Pseudooceanicola atlanticus]
MLWQMIIEDINHPSGPQRLTFCARINKRGRRLWMSKIDGKTFWIIFDHRTNMPITVLKVDDELTHCGRYDGTGQPIDLRTYLNA